MVRMLMRAFLAAGVAALLTSCGGDDDPPPTPIPTLTTSAAATPTVVPPTPSATPTATTTVPPDGYPLTQRTGIADVDVVLAALESKDEARLRALFVETPSPCVVNPIGIHDPPACPDGVASGTLLPVFRAMAGESVWPEYLGTPLRYTLAQDLRIHAVYRDAPPAFNGWLPAADYVIVTTSPEALASAVRVTDGRINGWWFGGYPEPGRLIEDVAASQFVLPPPGR